MSSVPRCLWTVHKRIGELSILICLSIAQCLWPVQKEQYFHKDCWVTAKQHIISLWLFYISVFREKSWRTSKSECVFVRSSGYWKIFLWNLRTEHYMLKKMIFHPLPMIPTVWQWFWGPRKKVGLEYAHFMLEISARLTLPKDALGNNYLCLISLLSFLFVCNFFFPTWFFKWYNCFLSCCCLKINTDLYIRLNLVYYYLFTRCSA